VNHQPEVGLEADARALIEATLSLLQLSGAWPSFDELDKYARHRTPETLRNAIVNLAGVLERHRELVKATFARKDKAALFEIANKFDLRHRDAGQRGDYDLDFFEWLFQWYLATVTLVVRRLDQQSPLTSAAKQ